jgi:3-deoxy-7-phosphoheptulonate synthase
MPRYAEEENLASVTTRLSGMPGLVDVAEIRELKSRLAKAGEGGMFVLQLGNAEERFEDVNSGLVREHVRNLESIHNYLALVLRTPVLPIGLIAGNYARTCAHLTETVDGVTMTPYFGDMVNELTPDPRWRSPDASRMLLAYEASLLALRSIRDHRFRPYTSHEVANLHFEEAMVRCAGMDEGFFASSAHMLWIEGINLFPGSSYLEFLRGVLNPIGMRVTPQLTAEDLLRVYELLNPAREPGKIVMVTSLGDSLSVLRCFIDALRGAQAPVVWMCDPWWARSGQSWSCADAFMQAVTAEVEHTALLHASEGSVLAGLRLEVERDGPVWDIRMAARQRRAAGMASTSRLDFLQALHVCSDLASAYGGAA